MPKLLATTAPAAVVLIRLAVGLVFTSEGLQKLIYPTALGVGRFAKIGIPAPDVTAPLVGGCELVCGLLVLAGLLTRVAVIPIIVIMVGALVSTKLPILLGHGFGPFADPKVAQTGLFGMLHEARTDLAMLLGALFLLRVGAGSWSVVARLTRRLAPPAARE